MTTMKDRAGSGRVRVHRRPFRHDHSPPRTCPTGSERACEGSRGAQPPSWLPPGLTVSVPGIGELFVRDSAAPGTPDRPPVLLLHGWGVTADVNFFNVYAELARSYRVLALDHRGHGRGMRSDDPFTLEECADDAARLLEVTSACPAIVLGYSMGGPVALLMAQRHPELVGALVVGASALEFHESVRERFVWHGLTFAEAALEHGRLRGCIERLLYEAVEHNPSLGSERAWIHGELRRGSLREILEAGAAIRRFDARRFATEIQVPAVVVLTTCDRLVAPRKQRALAASLRATVVELEADHDAPVSCGEAFRSVIRAAVDIAAERSGLMALVTAARAMPSPPAGSG